MTTPMVGASGPFKATLSPHVQAVERARAKFSGSMQGLEDQTRQEALYGMEKLVWKLFVGVLSGGAALVTTLALKSMWSRVLKDAPPEQPEDPDVAFASALGWTIIFAAGVGVMRFVASRGAANVWKRLTGINPPDFIK